MLIYSHHVDSSISSDDVVIKEKWGKSHELSRKTIFKDTWLASV